MTRSVGGKSRYCAALPPGTDVLALRSRSIAESLQGRSRPAANALIAVVSRWPEFLRWARTILVAAGLDPDSLSTNDIEVTHINLNDHTLEGFRHRREPVFCVQYHPEAAPGPHDSHYLFNDFITLMAEQSK